MVCVDLPDLSLYPTYKHLPYVGAYWCAYHLGICVTQPLRDLGTKAQIVITVSEHHHLDGMTFSNGTVAIGC